MQKRYHYTISNLNWIATGLIFFTVLPQYHIECTQMDDISFWHSAGATLISCAGLYYSSLNRQFVATHLKKLQAIAHSIKSLL